MSVWLPVNYHFLNLIIPPKILLSFIKESAIKWFSTALDGTFFPLAPLSTLQKRLPLKAKAIHIDLQTCVSTKQICRLVYRTELGKVVTVNGVIRGVFLQQSPPGKVAVFENGLPIPTQNILHIQRMEG